MEDILKLLLNKSYAIYSNYKVSCILELKDGSYVNGVNVENASYGATICAERNAITSAITMGYKKEDFVRLSIMNSTDKIGTPCMMCRQLFVEFFDKDMEIVCYDINGNKKIYKVGDLCPYEFSKDNL